jgi:Predicted permeases
MQRKIISTLDRYVFIQFVATYFFSIVLILAVAIAFDVTEKLDKLLQPEVPLSAIIWSYYGNFVPYYANLFSPLFVFIAVIYVTTRLAEHSEIIAILSCGMSFRRLLKPYMLGAAVIAALTFVLSSFIIPPGNRIRIDFQNRYIKDKRITFANTVQMQVAPETFMFMSYYNDESKIGYTFSMDCFEGKDLKSRMMANSIVYDTLHNWQLQDYTITYFGDRQDTLRRGDKLDTIIPITPKDFLVTEGDVEILTTPRLYTSIQQQQQRGAPTQLYAIELHKRIAMIPASFILTLMGVSLSARKRKGGMGLSLAVGLSLSFIYILFMTVTSSFAVTGAMSPMSAAWLPNLVYLVISFILYRLAPR